jgi:hypothetical protein
MRLSTVLIANSPTAMSCAVGIAPVVVERLIKICVDILHSCNGGKQWKVLLCFFIGTEGNTNKEAL